MRISDWSSDVCSSDLLRPLYPADGTLPVPGVGNDKLDLRSKRKRRLRLEHCATGRQVTQECVVITFSVSDKYRSQDVYQSFSGSKDGMGDVYIEGRCQGGGCVEIHRPTKKKDLEPEYG